MSMLMLPCTKCRSDDVAVSTSRLVGHVLVRCVTCGHQRDVPLNQHCVPSRLPRLRTT